MRTSRTIVLVWPNGREEYVKRTQLEPRLQAVKAQARKCGFTSSGHECHVVVAGTVRHIPKATKFTFQEELEGGHKIHQFKELTFEHEMVLTSVLRSVLVNADGLRA